MENKKIVVDINLNNLNQWEMDKDNNKRYKIITPDNNHCFDLTF